MIVRILSSQVRQSATTLLRVFIFAGVCFSSQLSATSNIRNPSDATVSDYLESYSQASIFVTALKETGLWSTLQNNGAVTLFVPTNQALYDEGSAFLLEVVLNKAENADRFRYLMSAHIYRGPVQLDDKTEGQSFIQSSLLNQDSKADCLAVTYTEGLAEIGPEASVIGSVKAKGGLIYFVDQLLWAAYKNKNTCM